MAIASGWIDLLAYQKGGVDPVFVRRHQIHSYPAYAATLLYLANFGWRWRAGNTISRGFLVLSVLGLILIAATGYLGGELRGAM